MSARKGRVMEHEPKAPRRGPQLVEEIYEAIKRDVIRCTIEPGEELYEGRLAEQYGVSKTPVREVLQRLVRDGLVVVRPRRGYVAAPITVKDVQEVFGARLLLEPAAAERAALHATEAQLRELQELAERAQEWSSGEDQFTGRAFHLAVARASGNQRLANMLERILEETARIFNLLELHHSTSVPPHAHGDLVDALLKGDHQRARMIRTRDIRASQKAVLEALLADRPSRNLQLLVTDRVNRS